MCPSRRARSQVRRTWTANCRESWRSTRRISRRLEAGIGWFACDKDAAMTPAAKPDPAWSEADGLRRGDALALVADRPDFEPFARCIGRRRSGEAL
eukprot:2587647-Prymnesium_polylepis.1